MAYEGMCAQEEDLLDQELLGEDQDHEEIEAEMEMDPQPSQAMVLSLLDYCNSLLAGLPASPIRPL